jgi:hypothetical protein
MTSLNRSCRLVDPPRKPRRPTKRSSRVSMKPSSAATLAHRLWVQPTWQILFTVRVNAILPSLDPTALDPSFALSSTNRGGKSGRDVLSCCRRPKRYHKWVSRSARGAASPRSDDAVAFEDVNVFHVDCRRPRDLTRQEPVLIVGYCWAHPILCPACGRIFQCSNSIPTRSNTTSGLTDLVASRRDPTFCDHHYAFSVARSSPD